tara:strand:+ start:223 stop:429 length:207 start_codon:yes stop_codon:yes gene_type:complete
MTQYKDIVEKQNQKIKQEKENNTLTSIGWQREEIGKPNVIRHKSYNNRIEYEYSDKRKKPYTETLENL